MGKLEDELNAILAGTHNVEGLGNTNSEYRKGGVCPYNDNFLFCQEGMCSECEIYSKWEREHKGDKNDENQLHKV